MPPLKRALSVVLSVSMLLSQVGCSMAVPGKQRFSVTASEPDAKIYVNGEYLGKGTVQTRVRRDDDVSILVKKDGYESIQRHIGSNLNFVGILDIIGGFLFLVPFVGVLTPGSRSLEQTNIAVVLEKDTSTPAAPAVPAAAPVVSAPAESGPVQAAQ